MRDTDLTDPGTAAPAGTDAASAPADAGLVDDRLFPKTARVSRAIVSVAAGTTVSPLDRSSYAKATNRGYGDAMGRGLELVLTLAVMAGAGWLIDRALGTAPLFTAILSVVGFAGISVKLWIGYDLEMRKHDDGAIWSRSTAVTPRNRPEQDSTSAVAS